MKRIFSIIAIALIGAFVMSSCNKNDYETEPLKTVNVSGKVEARLDLTAVDEYGNPVFQNAPTGTRIIFQTDSKNLCQKTDDSYTYSYIQYETTVDSNGNYSIDLPAVNFKAVTYTIIPVEFKANQRQNAAGAVIEYTYTAADQTVSVREGEIKYGVDITYN